MDDKLRQERFLAVVDRLRLKNPGTEIAEKMGYSEGTVSDYLNGNRTVSAKFFKNFCTAFGIDNDKIELIETKDSKSDKDVIIQSLQAALEAQKKTIQLQEETIEYLRTKVDERQRTESMEPHSPGSKKEPGVSKKKNTTTG